MPAPVAIPQISERAFLEYTYTRHGHGGEGWEFETCLWSPTRNAAGQDSYAVMREPEADDLVVHILDKKLAGFSRVAQPYIEVEENPPNPGDWEGRPPYYRIELRDYVGFPEPVPASDIREAYAEEIEMELQRGVPTYFALKMDRGVRFNERYLSVITPPIIEIFNQALRIPAAGSGESEEVSSGRNDFAEGKRRLREVTYFARNPQLVRRAKEKYGYVCQVCGFDYGEAYGDLGEGYIEVHHLNPLSERPTTEEGELTTGLDEVIVVCANCHRMLHRKRPALTPEELQEKRTK